MKKIASYLNICKDSPNTTRTVEKLKEVYRRKKSEIKKRFDAFELKWENGSEEEIFAELVFCILTPQSNAISCWNSVRNLKSRNLLLEGTERVIAKTLKGVRFHNKKAKYIIEARKLFSVNGKISIKPKAKQASIRDIRDWFVQKVKGLGYKEASHFLRNVGLTDDLAILDRHILRNLKLTGVIKEIPNSLPRKKYIDLEDRMREFAEKINIPIGYLDFVMWYKETGKIFK